MKYSRNEISKTRASTTLSRVCATSSTNPLKTTLLHELAIDGFSSIASSPTIDGAYPL